LLADQPLMRNVLADLAVESEAATVLAMRLAGAVDRAATGAWASGRRGEPGNGGEPAFQRLAIAAGKYWVCKRQPAVVGEALECLGGNGYVEESGLPRLYRDAPLNSIWEGSGNVQALDVLRTLRREPDSRDAYLAEVRLAAGADRRLDTAIAEVTALLAEADEGQARRVAERVALVLQGSLLVRHAPAATADAFCATRLARDHGQAFGTLPRGTDTEALIRRAAPQ
ncbi:MAG TPA: acyl-CoA dehydrogenase family protein, partial [Actinoplanes sp.]|nr:acyl-CoA dehydrogenase family protein [Actinoplanes sp.]